MSLYNLQCSSLQQKFEKVDNFFLKHGNTELIIEILKWVHHTIIHLQFGCSQFVSFREEDL
jgi:hypothetical protein